MPDIALYQPNDLQRRLTAAADACRFLVAVCPRQHGKSTFLRVEAVHRAVQGAAVAIIGPYRVQVKNIHWSALKLLALRIPDAETNETELKVSFPSGGYVQLFGSDNAVALRGLSLDEAYFDEAAYIVEDVYSLIVRPALSARQGRALFVSTPHGRNWFYALFQQAETTPGWARLHVTYADLHVIPPSEIAAIRQEQSDEEFAQEYACKWDAVQVGAIYAKELARAEAEHRVGRFPHDPSWPVVTAMDLGISDSTAILWVQPTQGAFTAIDYEEHAGLGLPDYVRLLKEKGRSQRYNYQQHIALFDLGNLEFGSGKTRIEVARELGIHFGLAPRLTLAEGLDTVKRLFPRLSINRGPCTRLLEALAAYHRVWRQDLRAFSDKPHHDWSSHAADGLRYFATGYQDRSALVPGTHQTQAVLRFNLFDHTRGGDDRHAQTDFPLFPGH
jgi:hypothetical protein